MVVSVLVKLCQVPYLTEYKVASFYCHQFSGSCLYWTRSLCVIIRIPPQFFHLCRLARGPTQPLSQWVAGFFARGEAAGAWCWQPPSIANVKNEWSFTSAPAMCLHGMDRYNLTFFFLPPIFWSMKQEKDSRILLNTVILQGQKVQHGSVSSRCSVPSSGQRFYSSLPPPRWLYGPLNLQSS